MNYTYRFTKLAIIDLHFSAFLIYIFYYQICITCCINREVRATAKEQEKPRSRGLPPVFTNFTISVFKPIAAIAIMIKNLLKFLSGVKKDALTPKLSAIVVIIEAKMK